MQVRWLAGASLVLVGATSAHAVADRPAPEPALVPLAALAIPVVDHGAVKGVLHVRASLNTADEGTADVLAARMPVLRARTLAGAGEFARLHAAPYRPVDVERLAASLRDALGPARQGAEVLILEAVVRPAA